MFHLFKNITEISDQFFRVSRIFLMKQKDYIIHNNTGKGNVCITNLALDEIVPQNVK